MVCFRCGANVTGARSGWRHALSGTTGAIPPSRKHKPVPVVREDFERAYDIATPRDEALTLISTFRALDARINGKDRT